MALLELVRGMEVPATVHGFRSSFRDWMAEETDVPHEIAEAALAHTLENKVEAAYRRTDFLAKRRELMKAWGDFCIPPARSRSRRPVEQTNVGADRARDAAPTPRQRRAGRSGLPLDKVLKAPDDDEGCPADLYDLDLARRNQLIKLGFADSQHMGCRRHADGQRFTLVKVYAGSRHVLRVPLRSRAFVKAR